MSNDLPVRGCERSVDALPIMEAAPIVMYVQHALNCCSVIKKSRETAAPPPHPSQCR
jgi:hypothetical protein